MSYELQVEAATLMAIAEALEKGDNAPEDYAIALHGMAHRLNVLSKESAV